MIAEQGLRDRRGRWQSGVSGNPNGRPRGSKNRRPRRRADLASASDWTRNDWRIFYNRAVNAAPGDLTQKHAAAFSETISMWLLRFPPVQRVGLCTYCGKALDVPQSSIGGAPIRADGAWLHWGCLPWFMRTRWDAAKTGVQSLGIVMENDA